MTKPAPNVTRLRVAHASMQFSDNDREHEHDARAVFDRAVARDYAWLTGTEAGSGSGNLTASLHEQAADHGYRFAKPGGGDVWLAVRANLIAGGWATTFDKVIDGIAHRYTDKGVSAVEFDAPGLGHVTVIGGHYITKGRPSGPAEQRTNLELNRRITIAIGDHARRAGRGSALVFYGGDQNIVDRTDDTFLGQPLTSAWDELGKWENTGHGNIDVIASYDRDGRVKAVDVDTFPDAEFRLASDHYLVEAVYDVRKLRV